jgi:hypothetical protein
MLRAIEGSEKVALMKRIPPLDDPAPFGNIMVDGAMKYLYFPLITACVETKFFIGLLSRRVCSKDPEKWIIVDVTGEVPAHFNQKFPVPSTFWQEVVKRLRSVAEKVPDIKDLPDLPKQLGFTGLAFILGIIVAVAIFLKLK